MNGNQKKGKLEWPKWSLSTSPRKCQKRPTLAEKHETSGPSRTQHNWRWKSHMVKFSKLPNCSCTKEGAVVQDVWGGAFCLVWPVVWPEYELTLPQKTPVGITSDRQAWHLVFNNFIICPLAPTQNHQSWFFRKNYESKVVATTTFWVTYQLTKLNSGFEGDLFPTEHQSSRDFSVWGSARQDRILHQLVKKHFGNSCDSMWFDDINSFDNVSVISYNPLACNQKIWTLSCCRILRSFKRILCPAFIHTQMPICAEG